MTRLIAGRAGGRRIAAPRGARTRPTTDRVREAVFSAITARVGQAGDEPLRGLGFLDLYAGSGAMALEAASRGAAPVLAVESDRAAAAVARRNAADTGLAVAIRVQRVEELASQPVDAASVAAGARGFDVVWADPPYALAADALDEVIAACVVGGWLARRDSEYGGGLFVVERSSRTPAPAWPPGMVAWARRYGETTIYYAEFAEEEI